MGRSKCHMSSDLFFPPNRAYNLTRWNHPMWNLNSDGALVCSTTPRTTIFSSLGTRWWPHATVTHRRLILLKIRSKIGHIAGNPAEICVFIRFSSVITFVVTREHPPIKHPKFDVSLLYFELNWPQIVPCWIKCNVELPIRCFGLNFELFQP